MTRKFSRNSLEDAFEALAHLHKKIDELTNRKETTLPFRDVSNLPPGVEGQVVLAEYVPLVLGPCSTFPVHFGVSHTGPMVYSGDTESDPMWHPGFSGSSSWFQIYKCNSSGVETAINPNHRENQSIPALSHDYSKVAYMAKDMFNTVEDGPGPWPSTTERLRVCNIDGTSLVTLDTWGPGTYTEGSPEMLVWSPDGTKVAANATGGGGHIYIYPVNGDPRSVISAPWYSPVSWSHDSQYIFYNSTSNSIVRRKWDGSDSEVVFLDGTVYHQTATFMIHPHDPILVFNYYESGATDPDDNRCLGFLNVDEPGCTPEFFTWGDMVAAGIWHTPYSTVEDQYFTNPQWSPDGRYVLAASEEERTITATPHYRTWVYKMFNRDLSFTASSSLFNTAGTASLINDPGGSGYRQQYPPTWVSFSSTQRVAGEEGDFGIDYSQYPLPTGPIAPLVQSDPAAVPSVGPPSPGFVWFRQFNSGEWFPSWSNDFEGKYYS